MPRIFRQVAGRGLTAVGDAVLLSLTETVSEGRIERLDDGTQVYSGSSMLRVDLRNVMKQENLSTEDLLRHIRSSVAFRLQLMRLARRETEIRCRGWIPGTLEMEMEVRFDNCTALIDIEVFGVLIPETSTGNSGTSTGHGP